MALEVKPSTSQSTISKIFDSRSFTISLNQIAPVSILSKSDGSFKQIELGFLYLSMSVTPRAYNRLSR